MVCVRLTDRFKHINLILRLLLTLCLCACIIMPRLPIHTSAESPLLEWNTYTLQRYSTDHSESTARGNWYNCQWLEANFAESSLEPAEYEGKILRSLRLETPVVQENSGHNLMFVNLYDERLLPQAEGMRFHIANPGDAALKLGMIYCDTGSIYSCLDSGAYYLEINGRLFRRSPKLQFDSFAEGGASDVGVIEIPAGFSGYLYVPFASTTRAAERLKFSRVRLTLGSTAGSASVLYLESIDYYNSCAKDFAGAQAANDYGFDADDILPAGNAPSELLKLGFTREFHDMADGKALKAEFSNTEQSYGYNSWRINGLWGKLYDSNADGMKFWIKNPDLQSLSLRLQFSDAYRPCRVGSLYYLSSAESGLSAGRTVKAAGENIGCIEIPPGYEGYVYLPYSLVNETAGHLIMAAAVSDKRCVYFDSFSSFCFSEFDSAILETFEQNENYLLNGETASAVTENGNSYAALQAYKGATVTVAYAASSVSDMFSDAFGEVLKIENRGQEVKFTVSGRTVRKYYLTDPDGYVSVYDAAGGIVTVPERFGGKITLPFTDSEPSGTLSITFASDTGGMIALDDIGLCFGAVSVTGDVNSDGVFDIADMVRLKKYLSGYDAAVDRAKADLNSDGLINSVDLALIRKGLLYGISKPVIDSGIEDGAVIEGDGLRVVKPKYLENADLIIAAYDAVKDFGADPSGTEDSAGAIRQALFAAECDGGGTVYLPEGEYLVSGGIEIPENVQLCGEWRPPADSVPGAAGTVLIAENDPAFMEESMISLSDSSAVGGLTVIYPNQNTASPIHYKPAITVSGYRCFTVENLTLLGAWDGIQLGSNTASNEIYYLNNVYISALNIGIYNDGTSDTGRMENVSCSPEYWTDNLLYPLTEPQKTAAISYFRENAEGFQFYMNDWSVAYRLKASGLSVGMRFALSPSRNRGMNGEFYSTELVNCDTGIMIEGVKIGGVCFTGLKISADRRCNAGIDTGMNFSGTCMFYDTEITGDFIYPVRNNGVSQTSIAGALEFVRGSIGGYDSSESYAVNLQGGSVTLQGISFSELTRHIAAGDKIHSLSVLGCTFGGAFDADIPSNVEADCQIDHDPINIESPPAEFKTEDQTPRFKDGKVVSVIDYGASVYSDDNTAAFMRALESLRQTGGTVYVPPGNWKFNGELTVPAGVELRGATPFQTMQSKEHRSGTVLWIFSGAGNENGTPFITLEQGSGLSGMCTYYSEQNAGGAAVPYPWTVRVAGSNCRISDIVLTNSYGGVDLSDDADGFLGDFISGAPLRCGISVNGNDVLLRNCHFNPNYSYVLTHNSASADFRLNNGDAFVIANSQNLSCFDMFAYGYKNGFLFDGNSKGVFTQCGIDGSETSVRMKRAEDVCFINAQLVSMESANEKHCYLAEEGFTGAASFYNSMLWGPTDYIVCLKNGKNGFYLVNLCTGYGEYALYAAGGSSVFNAATFHNSNILLTGDSVSVDFIGCFKRGYKTVINPISENGGKISVKHSFWA